VKRRCAATRARSIGLLELAKLFNNDVAEIGPTQPLEADDQAILAAFVAESTASGEFAAAAMPPATAEICDDVFRARLQYPELRR
jgi:hypothetical protein